MNLNEINGLIKNNSTDIENIQRVIDGAEVIEEYKNLSREALEDRKAFLENQNTKLEEFKANAERLKNEIEEINTKISAESDASKKKNLRKELNTKRNELNKEKQKVLSSSQGKTKEVISSIFGQIDKRAHNILYGSHDKANKLQNFNWKLHSMYVNWRYEHPVAYTVLGTVASIGVFIGASAIFVADWSIFAISGAFAANFLTKAGAMIFNLSKYGDMPKLIRNKTLKKGSFAENIKNAILERKKTKSANKTVRFNKKKKGTDGGAENAFNDLREKLRSYGDVKSISIDSLTDDSGTVNYAASEKDYSVTNDTLYFVDEINNPHPIGILSYLYPTDKEMSVTVELMAMWTWTGILFRFGVIYPQIITIEEYNSGVLRQVNDYVVTDKDFYLDHRFYDVDKIVVTFSGVEDNTRIHLNKMIFGNILSYCIKEHEMQELPKASLTDRVKNIYVKYYNFIQSPKTITATTIAEVGENLITIDKPCYEYVLEYSDETVQGILNIIESGAYYLIFTSTVAASVSVKAYQYERAENTISTNINDTGNDITLENALISNRDVAERVLKWFEEYYKSDVAYTIRYRGEPALECNDRIFLENRFVNNNQILITDEEISTSTGMNLGNTVKALRLGYTEK